MDVTTFNMAESHSPAEQFRPTKAFSFPKRQFGCKGDQRSFHAEWCDTLSRLHYTMPMQMRIYATSVAMRGAVILHVRKLQSYCSLRAGEADPCPSNFVSTTDFKQKARFGSKFLLFPQLCYFISRLHQKQSQKVRNPKYFPGGVPQTSQGLLSVLIPTCRTNRKLLPTGLILVIYTYWLYTHIGHLHILVIYTHIGHIHILVIYTHIGHIYVKARL